MAHALTNCEIAQTTDSNYLAMGDCYWDNHVPTKALEYYSLLPDGPEKAGRMGTVYIRTLQFDKAIPLLSSIGEYTEICDVAFSNDRPLEAQKYCVLAGPIEGSPKAVLSMVKARRCTEAVDLVKNQGFCKGIWWCEEQAYNCIAYKEQDNANKESKYGFGLLFLLLSIGCGPFIILAIIEYMEKRK